MSKQPDYGIGKITQFQAGYASALSDVFQFIDDTINNGSASLDTSELAQFRKELEIHIGVKGVI